MAARATASGTISFGLVSIPVKVYTATQSKSARFNMLHASDKSRLRQQLVCNECGEVVGRKQTVKGYEYARDQYVVMTDEELKALEQKSDHAIEIDEFIPIERIDPVYFDHANLLGPDKGGSKAYQLLCEAMRESGRVAVGRYASRGRHQLVLLRPTGEGLMLHSLFYADEVRSFDDIDLGESAAFREGELGLAKQLIDQLSRETFDPGRYEDDYRKAVLDAVEQKVAGEEVVVAPRPEAPEKIIDLVAALKQSLAEKRAEVPEPARKASRPKKSAAGKG